MTDPQLAIGIQYAPWDEKRTRNAKRMKRNLQADGFHCELVAGSQSENVWQTARRGYREVPNSEDTHFLMLQDDIKLCNNFSELARRAVAVRPESGISLFSMRSNATNAARNQGYNWIRATEGLWGQGILLPVEWIDDMIEWCDNHFDQELGTYDARVAMWLEHARDELAWCTVPSLVEHVGHNDSILGNRSPQDRVASWYEQEPDVDAIDYTVVDDPPTATNTSVIDRYTEHILVEP